MINYSLTKNNITIYHNDLMKTYERTDGKFHKIVDFIKEKNWKAIEEILVKEDGQFVSEYTNDVFEVKSGNLYLKNEVVSVNNVIAERLKDFYENDLPWEPLLKFWKKLRNNPSSESVQQLYDFLEINKHPLTVNGNFIAYKQVTKVDVTKENIIWLSDVEADGKPSNMVEKETHHYVFKIEDKYFKYVDSYSKKFDNAPGVVVEMDRWEVDPNKNVTCSKGLHVANWDYAQDFSGNVLMKLSVDPTDVVAVPNDYQNAKMRVCKYTVLEDLKDMEKPTTDHLDNTENIKLDNDNETVLGQCYDCDEEITTEDLADYDNINFDEKFECPVCSSCEIDWQDETKVKKIIADRNIVIEEEEEEEAIKDNREGW